MEELDDKEFDQIFKNRIKEGYLDFEEESWLKMERKLRKRDRFVFLRNASILLAFLSIGMAIYLMGDKKMSKDEVVAVKQIKGENEKAEDVAIEKSLKDNKSNVAVEALKNQSGSTSFTMSSIAKENPIITEDPKVKPSSTLNNQETISNQDLVAENPTAIAKNDVIIPSSTPEESNNSKLIDVSVGKSMGILLRRKPITLSINVGPDFSSTENTLGGKSGIALGIGINVPISGKFSMQTGINYGSKNYDAKAYDYAFTNPNAVNIISGIDASCNVLEIPLRVSYTISGNSKNKFDINAGVSSYIMLKENYRFMYTPASGRQDRFLEEKNANQHYLSVIDLSATYNIKLKNKRFAFGLEPYVKIPLTGIGEGSVPLKSSGISLKLNYELNKKN